MKIQQFKVIATRVDPVRNDVLKIARVECHDTAGTHYSLYDQLDTEQSQIFQRGSHGLHDLDPLHVIPDW